MQTIKICCFCEMWESGGIESFLYNIYSRFDPHEFVIHIAVSELKASIFTEKLCAQGIIFHELSGNRKKVLKNYRMFINLLRKERYDVLHLNVYHGMSLFYICLSKLMGVKVRIAHAHNTHLKKNNVYFWNVFLHNAAKWLFSDFATCFWACSEKAAKFTFSASALSRKGFIFIPNGVEIDKFKYDHTIRAEFRNKYGLTGHLVIGNVGRICYQKNQEFLIDILNVLIKHHHACKLLLVGEGEAQGLLEQKVAQLGLNDSVVFLGASSHIMQLMCAMDVFVFPSRFEGLGIVAIEAQAMGLPVICSENIPYEAHVTPSIRALPLDAGAEFWAKNILNCKTSLDDRTQNRDYLIKAGFDISHTVSMIEAGYKNI